MSDQEVFYADEFFLDEDDPGIEVKVQMRGRLVPICIKRGLTLDDQMAAEAAAIKKSVGLDGKVVFQGLDEGALVREMLFRYIRSWPFTDRKTVELLPITRENVGKMLGGSEALMQAIKNLNDEGEKVLAPFVEVSTEA